MKMGHDHISLNGSQAEAFEQAAEVVREDLDDDDASKGDIVEQLSYAYLGLL